jgi:hypothetical protein
MPKHNTDGMGNCLQQPGQLLNLLEKSMGETTSQLIKFVYHDYSCCRDKVNRAAVRRAVVMVFACHLDSFIVTGQILPVYRDSAIWTTLS